eukprot:444973_1
MSMFLIILINTFICGKTIDGVVVRPHVFGSKQFDHHVQNSELTEGSNQFGYELSHELYTDPSTNIWLSPFCISSCFALIYPGTATTTQTEIANVLHFPTTTSNPGDVTQQYFSLQSSIQTTYNGEPEKASYWSDKSSIIGIANKIYISNLLTPNPTYITALTNGITQQQSFIQQNFDFSASDANTIINNWVNDNTNGLIDSIIDENKDISHWRLLALNAIYLNGSFASQFAKHMTSIQKFYSNGLRTNEVSNIHLMHQKDYFYYYSDGNYQFLKFPFSDTTDLFVLFALPINSQLYNQRNGLITDEHLIQTAIQNLQRTYIALALPKISIKKTYKLNETLPNMGMINAFINGQADFSNLADAQLFIDTVIHKTMIEMDENGLVAAAVTGLVAATRQRRPQSLLFKADHPFQMFIIDGAHDNVVLFMGQINNPGIPQGNDVPNYDESIDSIWNDFALYTSSVNTVLSSLNTPQYSTVMNCVLPNTDAAGCAGRITSFQNAGVNFKLKCTAPGACAGSTFNFTYVNSMVPCVEQISFSEPFAGFRAEIIMDSTQSTTIKHHIDKFECKAW